MADKQFYISQALKHATMDLLERYAAEHTESRTPMADAYAATPNVTEEDKKRFVRAARCLGWKVVKVCKNVYENGVLVWRQE